MAADSETPNFVIINIDDLGYADIGAFGSTLNRTPNLDRMAKEGRLLTSHYAAPVCSPSRASLMTGCYPKRVLPIPGVLFPAASVGLNPQEVTIAEVLKTQGYATACVGKWHLGDQPEFLPTVQGFDSYFGIPYSNDMGTQAEGSKSDLGAPLPNQNRNAAKNQAAPTDADPTGLKGNNQPPLPLLKDAKLLERVGAAEQQTLTQRYTEEAVRFLHEHKDEKFFLYLPHTAVHFPLYPGMEFHAKSNNGLIGDWIEEVDWSVGQVLDTLRELKLDKNTLVIFTSDNGGTPRSVNRPLRGFKGSTWEGGMRAPTIAWWPGKIPPETTTHEITSMMDLLPTFATLAGAQLPGNRIDGGNIWPLMAGATDASSPHQAFYYFKGLKLEAVRKGSWKLHLAVSEPAGNGKAGKKNGKQAGSDSAPTPQLFNLDEDVSESTNLAEKHPEIMAELMALAQEMDSDLGNEKIGPGCRVLGRVENAEPIINVDGTIRAEFR
ncbi:MAG: sulfatase [Fuerstia sp.]|nr:sulfatase [Fuerstiella sp.]